MTKKEIMQKLYRTSTQTMHLAVLYTNINKKVATVDRFLKYYWTFWPIIKKVTVPLGFQFKNELELN